MHEIEVTLCVREGISVGSFQSVSTRAVSSSSSNEWLWYSFANRKGQATKHEGADGSVVGFHTSASDLEFDDWQLISSGHHMMNDAREEKDWSVINETLLIWEWSSHA
jgi:hypothetical protein